MAIKFNKELANVPKKSGCYLMYNKDNVVKPKITSEEAEFILNQYMGLYHQITEREESGFVVDYSLKKEQELYRKILLEYKYGKPFEDLNNEQKSFRPEDKLIPKRKCNFEERYNEDPIADYVNTKFRGLNEVERYEIYEKLKKEDIDIDIDFYNINERAVNDSYMNRSGTFTFIIRSPKC